MVRITGPLHSMQARGSIANQIVFKQKGNRSIATSYSTPGSKNTFIPNAAQIAKRFLYGVAVETWQTFTQEEKTIYNNRIKYKNLSGWNLFLKEFMLGLPWSIYGIRTYGTMRYGKTEPS